MTALRAPTSRESSAINSGSIRFRPQEGDERSGDVPKPPRLVRLSKRDMSALMRLNAKLSPFPSLGAIVLLRFSVSNGVRLLFAQCLSMPARAAFGGYPNHLGSRYVFPTSAGTGRYSLTITL